MIELAAENAPGRVKIGTTSRGIGPTYEDKMHRSGLRVQDLLDKNLLQKHIENAVREKNNIAHALFNSEPLDPDKMFADYSEVADRVAPFVADTALLLNGAIANGESVMFEGAQGTMLDIDHGTYPYVTSSSAISGGATVGVGVPPTKIKHVLGISKAYTTRVGGGPFPTEMPDLDAQAIRERGKEFGAVTGRPRRCGWLDLAVLRYADYGCAAYGFAIIVNPAFAAAKADAVRGFIRATIAGTLLAIRDPAPAANEVVKLMVGV